jgi:Sigma-70 region 2
MTIAESPETSLSKPEIAVPFEQTVLQEAPHLYAIAMTITRDPTEAEDVLQDTMLAAWALLAEATGSGLFAALAGEDLRQLLSSATPSVSSDIRSRSTQRSHPAVCQ